MKQTIELNIQQPAKEVGITNGRQLADATGLALNTSYDLINHKTTRMDLKTLAILTEVLKCEVQTILVIRRRRELKNGKRKS